MRSCLKVVFLPIYVLTLLLIPANAQISASEADMGIQPYQSYHGGAIDNISLATGSISLDFPFLSYPQRGKIPIEYHLVYNDQPQHYDNYCTTDLAGDSTCWVRWNPPTFGSTAPGKGTVAITSTRSAGVFGYQYTQPYTNNQSVTLGDFYLQLYDGSIHHLGNLGTMTYTSTGTANTSYWYTTQSGPFETADGTGWRVTGKFSSGTKRILLGSIGASPTSILSPEGVNYQSGTGMEDSNGNLAAANSDTIGRAYPSMVSTTDTSKCVGPGSITSVSTWLPPEYGSAAAPYTFCYTTVATNFPTEAYYGSADVYATIPSPTYTVLQSIGLPNGQSWEFEYTDSGPATNLSGSQVTVNYGTLSKITLPTGGTISYTYKLGSGCGSTGVSGGRMVATRTVNANDGTGPHTWSYQYLGTTTIVTDPLGNDTAHKFLQLAMPSIDVAPISCYEQETDYYQGSYQTGTLLKTDKTTYSQSGWTVQPVKVVTAWPSGQSTERDFTYDSFGYLNYQNQGGSASLGKKLTEKVYDYNGTLLQSNSTSYAWQPGTTAGISYANSNLLNLISQQTVGIETTNYGYDETATQPSGVSATYKAAAPTAYPGNLTSVTRVLSGGTNPVSRTKYWDTGEPYQVTDADGNTTTYLYDTAFLGAYVTEVDRPNTASCGISAAHVTKKWYDFNTGLTTSSTDENGQTTTYGYDVLNRLLQLQTPNGATTTLAYTDTPSSTSPMVHKQVQISSSMNADTYVQFDGLGRQVRSVKANGEDTPYDEVDTCYDAVGRKSNQTYPYQSNGITGGYSCAVVPSQPYDAFAYDGLGRVLQVTKADGAVQRSDYSQYPVVTTTDEALARRSIQTDALGRLVYVWEDPAGKNYRTDYSYDPSGDLLSVKQEGGTTDTTQWRTRTFTYDSLARLLTAKNPEVGTSGSFGTISYTYSAAGDLLTKTSPAPNQQNVGTTITYQNAYDQLHRLVSSTSSGQNSNQYCYDGSAGGYPIGRLTQSTSAGTSGAVYRNLVYDKMGNITSEQLFPKRGTSSSATFNYGYSLDNSLQWVQYPSQRTITYTPNVGQRTVSAIDNANSVSYVTGAHYTAWGSLAGAIYGSDTSDNGVTISNQYNSRMQPAVLSAANFDSTLLSLSYGYTSCVSNGGNNGNVCQIANNIDSSRSQSFTYDSLNRLSTAQTAATSGTSCWGEAETIDPWGNLTARAVTKCSADALSVAVNTNNQIIGQSYDAAGNLWNGGAYVYDGRNQLVSSAGLSFDYDAEGQRVSKSDGTLYWYGSGGEVLQESDLSLNPTSEYIYFNGKRIARRDVSIDDVKLYLSDHLGSSSVITDIAGNLMEEYGYAPYGEVYWQASHTPKTCLNAQGMVTTCPIQGGQSNMLAPGDTNHYLFTGKERDSETGLDYFGARYYGSNMGRFMSPDWSTNAEPVPYAKLDNPQSLNLYSYVGNNPLSRRDPDGHIDVATQCKGKPTCNVTLTQTVNIVHQQTDKATGQTKTVVDSTLKVTTNFSVTTDAKGNVSASASSTVQNVSGHAFSASQLETMGTNIGAMQQAAVTMGFGANTTQLVTAIGAAETRFGAAPNGTGHAWMDPSINPMQLTGGNGANLDRHNNIQGAMNILDWAGRRSDFSPGSEPGDTYYRYSDHSANTMANWGGTYNSITEKQ